MSRRAGSPLALSLIALSTLCLALLGVRGLGASPPARSVHPRGPLGGGQLIDGECPARYPRCISFTFDDGPDYRTTPALLQMLDERRIKATFFVVGHRLEPTDTFHRNNRAVLAEIARRGHTIGNHSHRHVLLDGLRPDRLAHELDRTDALIRDVTGRRPALFRAPFGELATRRSVEAVFSRGYTPAYWSIDTHDWAVFDTRSVLRNFRTALDAHPRGGVVLMHDTRMWSVRAFPLIFAEVQRRNAALVARGEAPYRFTTLGAFYRPLGAEAPRGMPQSHRRRNRASR